jgi:hypothetical protein
MGTGSDRKKLFKLSRTNPPVTSPSVAMSQIAGQGACRASRPELCDRLGGIFEEVEVARA